MQHPCLLKIKDAAFEVEILKRTFSIEFTLILMDLCEESKEEAPYWVMKEKLLLLKDIICHKRIILSHDQIYEKIPDKQATTDNKFYAQDDKMIKINSIVQPKDTNQTIKPVWYQTAKILLQKYGVIPLYEHDILIVINISNFDNSKMVGGLSKIDGLKAMKENITRWNTKRRNEPRKASSHPFTHGMKSTPPLAMKSTLGNHHLQVDQPVTLEF